MLTMNTASRVVLALLRVALGWFMFYAGITKVLNPNWSAAGYLNNAKQFSEFYHWLASPATLPLVNFVNEWGLTLLGVSLILGIGVRLSSVLGAVLMILYYAALPFPQINANSYVVDDHIIFILILLFLASVRAGRIGGLDNWCGNLPVCRKYPRLHALWG